MLLAIFIRYLFCILIMFTLLYKAIANNVQRTARQGMVVSPVAFTAVKVIKQDGIGVNQNIDFESVFSTTEVATTQTTGSLLLQ